MQKRFNNGRSKSTGKLNTENKKPRSGKQQVAKCKSKNTTNTKELEGRFTVGDLFEANKLAIHSPVQIKEGGRFGVGRFGVVQEAGGFGGTWKVRLNRETHFKPFKPNKQWSLHEFNEEDLRLVDENGCPQLQYFAGSFEPNAMDSSLLTLYKESDLGIKLGPTLDSNSDYYDYMNVSTTGKEAEHLGITNKTFFNVHKDMKFKRPPKEVGGKLQYNNNKNVWNLMAKQNKKLESLKEKLTGDDPPIPIPASDPSSSEDEEQIVDVNKQITKEKSLVEVNRQIVKEKIAKIEKSLKKFLAGSELQLELKEVSLIEFCETDNKFLKATVEMSSGRMIVCFGWIRKDNDDYYSGDIDVRNYVYRVDKLHYVSSPQPSYDDKECPKCIKVNGTLGRNINVQNAKKAELEIESDLPDLRKAQDHRAKEIKQLKQRIKNCKSKPNCTEWIQQQKLQKQLDSTDEWIKKLDAEVKKAMDIFRREEVPYNFGMDKIKGTCECPNCKEPGCPISNSYVAMQVTESSPESVDKCAVLSVKARDRRCKELSFGLSEVNLAVKIHGQKVLEKSTLEEEERKLRLALEKVEWADLPSQSSFAALNSGVSWATFSEADEVERLYDGVNDGVREAEIRDQLKKNQQIQKRFEAEIRDLRKKMNRRKEVFGAKISTYDHVLLQEGSRERARQTEFSKLWAIQYRENKKTWQEMRKAMQHVGSKRGADDDDKEEVRRRHDDTWLEYSKMPPAEVMAIFKEQCKQSASQSTISNQKSAADKVSTSEEEKRNSVQLTQKSTVV